MNATQDVQRHAWQGALFASTQAGEANERWGTPLALFEALRAMTAGAAGFALDAAAEAATAKAPVWLGPSHGDAWMRDCLTAPWSRWVKPGEWVWLNPPYGVGVHAFISKARDEVRANGINLVLLPLARTDTRWWHDGVLGHASQLVWIKGRVSFVDPVTRIESKNACPAPSVAVVYRQGSLGEARSVSLSVPSVPS